MINVDRIADLVTEDNRILSEAIDLDKVLAQHQTLAGLLKKFNINPENLRAIGEGDRGTAFSDGKLVVKITDDDTEASSSYTILGKSLPGVVPILFVGALANNVTGEPLYLIISELADTKLSPREKELADSIGDILVYQKQWPFDVDQVTNKVFVEIYKKTREVIRSPRDVAMVKQILKSVNNLYVTGGVKFFDVSDGNIGKDKDGNFVVFDLGISTSKRHSLPVVESFDYRKLVMIF